MNCGRCGKSSQRDGDKLPRGWKRHAECVWCGDCWRSAFVMRAITIPVVRPLGDGIGWPQLREALAKAWSQSTALANFVSTQSYVRDTPREPSQAKLGKIKTPYLYPDARERFPDMPTAGVVGQLQKLQRNYAAQRYDVLWTCSASLRSYRYPQPYAIGNQNWTPSYEPAGKDGGDKVPCVSVPLPGGRILLQLRGGREFARQLRDFAKLASGDAIKADLSICRQRASSGYNGGQDRDNGGQKFATRVMVKMVGWFPRSEARELSGTLAVRTDADSFLFALDAKGERIWALHADHVRRWTAEHSRRLNRWSDDTKAEQRPVPSFASRRDAAVKKFRDRCDSFVKEAACQLANFAQRRKYATVKLDDTDKSYLPRFDWSGFRSRLAVKLDEYGIALDIASGEAVPETPTDAREVDEI